MPKICVSIAVEDPEALKKEINRAFGFGADYIEIRFDYLKLSDMEQVIKIAELVRTKSVFTLRASEEGGKFKGSTTDRILWLKKLSSARPMLLDVEFKTIKDNTDFADYLEKQKIPILVSWHDFEKTPPDDELSDLLEKMRMYSNYIKIVTTAKNTQDALRLLDLYETAIGLNLIAFAMGEEGIISRILCTIFGNAPFTYAALEKAISPGQLTIKQMRKLYDRIIFLLDRAHAKPT